MITEDYVSFEIAKLLKERWFDDKYTNAFYDKNGNLYFIDTLGDFSEHPDNDTDITASTLYMVMKQLRKVHNLFIQITVDFSDGAYPMYDACVVNLAICTSIVVNGHDRYSYKESVEAAIKYCLENLVK